MRVGLIATHPIQYQVPWFRALAAQPELHVKVFYSMLPDAQQQGVGFGVPFTWDVPLLDGYEWEVLTNAASEPSLRGFRSNSTPRVGDALRKMAADAVIITGWNALPLVQGYWAAMRLGIPRIVRGESNALRPRPLRTRLVHRAYLRGFNAYLSIGRANRDFYRGYGVPAERIFSTHYFVDNARFEQQMAEALPQRNALRARWRIPPGSACFVYAGKLEPKKRILDLLRALEKARALNDGLHLLVVGDGELMGPARALTEERQLPVSFTGFLNQTEITMAYAAGDCLVLPSDFGETWGLVVNEAMACGLPAIVSDRVGCAADLVVEGHTGRTFPFGEIDALADRLLQLSHEVPRRRMAAAAHQHIQQYSVDAATRGTLDALDYVMAGHSINSAVPAAAPR